MDPEEEMARQAEQMMKKKNKPKKQPLIKRDVNRPINPKSYTKIESQL